jgi:branched-chain amino acid transport system substrate-binding protein
MPAAMAEPRVVRVGYAHSLTGPFAKLGANFERTVRFAEQQINSNGGIRGKMLELVTKDTQGSADGATGIAQELVGSGISAIITDDGTAPGLAMLGVTVPANAVLVFGTAQAIALSKPDNNGLFFRPGSNTFDEAGPLTAAIVADGHARIAVLSSTVAYATALYAEVEKTFLASTCAGAPCEIAHHATYPSDADFATFDFAPLITEALASNPDALFVSAFPTDAKVLLPAIWAAGYRGPIYASAAPNNGSLAPSLVAEQAEKIKWAAVQGASGPSIEFVSKLWADAGHAATDFAGPVLSNYDAMFLLGLALAHANSLDGKVIAESLRRVANAPGEPIYAGDWAKALAAIESGRDIDYVGVTSDVNFDALGNNDKIVTVIKTYRNGEPVVVASE